MKRLLTKANFNVTICHNGIEAIDKLSREKFDCVITDWMMPHIDGIELIRRIRESINPIPYIIMVTALVTESAKVYALDSGADDYIAKPIDIVDFAMRVEDGISKTYFQDVKSTTPVKVFENSNKVKPKTPALTIATSTGGPPALISLLKDLPENFPAPIFIVQHGPIWMLETFATRLDREINMSAKLGENGEQIKPGVIYIAPGDVHMRVTSYYKIILDDGPKENFVRPAADPLFVSVASVYGKYAIGVSLTGLGKDSAMGAETIVSNGGIMYAQDPKTAVAPTLPNSVINTGIKVNVMSIENMVNDIQIQINNLVNKLK
jgi:two-component system chemotaxis response regulator CheB